MENDVLYNRIMNVIHEEYGEGSTSVANPEGEATGDLEKIQIGDDIYNIAGGGGGGEKVLILHVIPDGEVGYHLDKTVKEIKDAVSAGCLVAYQPDVGQNVAIQYLANITYDYEYSKYLITFFMAYFDSYDGMFHPDGFVFEAETENDYPS